MNRFAFLTAAAAIAAPLTACNVTTQGEEGLVRFTYEDPMSTFGANLDTAIAVGTRATLDVQSINATAGVRVRGASFDTAGVAEVVGSEMNTLTLEGQAPGEARLVIETDRGADATTIRVEEAAWIGVHAAQANEKVLIGGIETLTIERRNSVGQTLVGVAPAELAIAPSDVGERVDGADSEFRLRYTTAGGQSFTVGDATVVREVVTADAVAMLDFASQIEGSAIAAGGEALGLIQAEAADGAAIGAIEGALAITSLTPEICSAGYRPVVGMPGLAIEGLSAGDCVVEGRIGALAETLTISID